ncbi:GGDEF domain-containing protein [Frankia sp. CNm7]|nr:GGDEF domain-containing protein [Frankia nepalensis]MBL7513083.1 GGDEF domain-containing protein [Frankia nepalensis]MBL7522212.1 GGDEF domain-containing protein [Frankia nepalensis]
MPTPAVDTASAPASDAAPAARPPRLPARPPAAAIVGATAHRLPARTRPGPVVPPARPELTGPGPAPGDAFPGSEKVAYWRTATLTATWLGLAVAWLTHPTFRLADLVTFACLLTLAALALVTTRGLAGQRRAQARDDLLTIWTLPVALLLPPGYALLAHLPLCLPQGGGTHARAGRPADESATTEGARGRVARAAALGIAGAAASWLHGVLAPAAGPYTAHTLVGSPARVAALAAATLAYAAVRALLLTTLTPALVVRATRPGHPSPTAGPGGRSPLPAGAGPEAVALCCAVAVATLWAANPLLMITVVPPALVLVRSLPPEELLAAARTDPKTGLANAAWWREVADAELARTRRAGRPLSVLLVDIDHFKQVNDRHGHLFGDTVLVAVADALRAATRPWDLVGRFGGEEFVVLLADVDLPAAAEIAERIRARVAATRCPLGPLAAPGGPSAVGVTVSIGAATCPAAVGLADALEAADAALYQAKNAGRDRVRLAAERSVADRAVTDPAPPPVPAQTAQPD